MTMTRLHEMEDEPQLFQLEAKVPARVSGKAPQKPTFPAARKAPNAFRTISEVAQELDMQQHVLRFWETKFSQIKPLKRGGGRRYYRAEDVSLLRQIHSLLYGQGYTIKGAQKVLKEGRIKPAVKIVQPAPASVAKVATPAPQDHALLKELLAELKTLRALV